MMDWIVENQMLFVGIAFGAWVVLCVFCFAMIDVHDDAKKLERDMRAYLERTDRGNDYG